MPAEESPTEPWFVVSQVKSNRVVYFTDDMDYVPPMQGDWYYVSPHQGPLPKGMTLRNCWRWRFDGHAFIDAGEPPAKPKEVLLLESNKAALLKHLHEKIDALRRPFATSNLMGEEVRAAKLKEAQALLAGTLDSLQDGYLAAAAAATNCTVLDMAKHIVHRQEVQQAILQETERVRMRLKAEIDKANTQSELIALRQQIMSELVPDLNVPIRPDHTTERRFKVQPTEQELAQEQIRLNLQLREKINDLRRPYVSRYLLDDVVLKHKGQIAQAVVAHGGSVPLGMDAVLLISHAAARGQTLLAAAKDVLAEIGDTSQVLQATEQLKDAWSVRIAGVKTFKDIEDLGRAIGRLQLQSPYQSSDTAIDAGGKS